MARRGSKVAMVSMHTSPTARPGTGDAGGMNLVVLELARALAASGSSVDLLTRAAGPPREFEVAPGVTLRELAAGPPHVIPKSELVGATDEFGEQIARLAGRGGEGYDVIHAHYWLSGLAALPVALEHRIPLVQSFHTLAFMKNRALPPGVKPEPATRLAAERFLASQVDAVITSSAAEADALIDGLGAPSDRTWVVPPGVDLALFTPERARNEGRLRGALGLEPERPIVVVAGRVQPLKGHELAVRALGVLAPRLDGSPILVVAGETTPDATGFRQHIDALARDVGTDVRFVGALDRVTLADLLALAAVTLVPSYSETFGLIALESAASGTPVIAQRSSGLLASVDETRSGILIESRSPADWATAIGALLDASAEERSLSRNGAREFAEGFSWAMTAASTAHVYAPLIAARL